MLEVLAWHDPLDATSSPLPTKPYRELLKEQREHVTMGIADDYFEGVDPEVVTAVQQALQESFSSRRRISTSIGDGSDLVAHRVG
jgi:aspartyl-tRNA(Asn)/glutamyl-tRNA(Gln) amidotransferase subunit A